MKKMSFPLAISLILTNFLPTWSLATNDCAHRVDTREFADRVLCKTSTTLNACTALVAMGAVFRMKSRAPLNQDWVASFREQDRMDFEVRGLRDRIRGLLKAELDAAHVWEGVIMLGNAPSTAEVDRKILFSSGQEKKRLEAIRERILATQTNIHAERKKASDAVHEWRSRRAELELQLQERAPRANANLQSIQKSQPQLALRIQELNQEIERQQAIAYGAQDTLSREQRLKGRGDEVASADLRLLRSKQKLIELRSERDQIVSNHLETLEQKARRRGPLKWIGLGGTMAIATAASSGVAVASQLVSRAQCPSIPATALTGLGDWGHLNSDCEWEIPPLAQQRFAMITDVEREQLIANPLFCQAVEAANKKLAAEQNEPIEFAKLPVCGVRSELEVQVGGSTYPFEISPKSGGGISVRASFIRGQAPSEAQRGDDFVVNFDKNGQGLLVNSHNSHFAMRPSELNSVSNVKDTWQMYCSDHQALTRADIGRLHTAGAHIPAICEMGQQIYMVQRVLPRLLPVLSRCPEFAGRLEVLQPTISGSE